MTDDAAAELKIGDRIRVTFETTVEREGERPMIRIPMRGPFAQGHGFYPQETPGLTYEVIPPEIKPLDIIKARWIGNLPPGSIVTLNDQNHLSSPPWLKVHDGGWRRSGAIDLFRCPQVAASYRVLRVGWGFQE